MALVLEEPASSMYTLVLSLKAAGYNVQSLFEETRVVAKIMPAMHRHVLLLMAHGSQLPVRTFLTVQALRGRGYAWPVVYCVPETVTPTMQSAYKELLVNRVVSVPAGLRPSVLATLGWIGRQVDLSASGMTVLEF